MQRHSQGSLKIVINNCIANGSDGNKDLLVRAMSALKEKFDGDEDAVIRFLHEK